MSAREFPAVMFYNRLSRYGLCPKRTGFSRMCIPSIHRDRLCCLSTLMLMIRNSHVDDVGHTAQLTYDHLFPILAGEPFQMCPPDQLSVKPAWAADEIARPIAPQKAGTCYLKGPLAALHCVMGGAGFNREQQKALFALFRYCVLQACVDDLKISARNCDNPAILVSDHMVHDPTPDLTLPFFCT